MRTSAPRARNSPMPLRTGLVAFDDAFRDDEATSLETGATMPLPGDLRDDVCSSESSLFFPVLELDDALRETDGGATASTGARAPAAALRAAASGMATSAELTRELLTLVVPTFPRNGLRERSGPAEESLRDKYPVSAAAAAVAVTLVAVPTADASAPPRESTSRGLEEARASPAAARRPRARVVAATLDEPLDESPDESLEGSLEESLDGSPDESPDESLDGLSSSAAGAALRTGRSRSSDLAAAGVAALPRRRPCCRPAETPAEILVDELLAASSSAERAVPPIFLCAAAALAGRAAGQPPAPSSGRGGARGAALLTTSSELAFVSRRPFACAAAATGIVVSAP
jgi:hypothetical protein